MIVLAVVLVFVFFVGLAIKAVNNEYRVGSFASTLHEKLSRLED